MEWTHPRRLAGSIAGFHLGNPRPTSNIDLVIDPSLLLLFEPDRLQEEREELLHDVVDEVVSVGLRVAAVDLQCLLKILFLAMPSRASRLILP
jgi:hypothetical protein